MLIASTVLLLAVVLLATSVRLREPRHRTPPLTRAGLQATRDYCLVGGASCLMAGLALLLIHTASRRHEAPAAATVLARASAR